MDSLSMRKYKDDLPINTINKIRNKLNELGILPIEAGWKNSVEGYFSVTLRIENTNLTTNGKGTTYEYALASAYGELMERLQNQAPFRLAMDLSPEALKYKGFYYAPDEKYLGMEDLLNSDDDWFKKQMDLLKPGIDKNELLTKWLSVSYENVPSDFVTLPYHNLRNNRISYIPIKMVSKMYMSNGMCAGNTVEEALVQGISEILERYVNKTIIMNRTTPPTVPYEYIQKFPRVDAMIKRIKSMGNYNVIIKDCSLGEGYPVTAVIFINKNEQTYFIKFGAHPVFEISVERTLTELMQGQDINNMMGMKEFRYRFDVDDEFKNLMDVFAQGSGFYPVQFFAQKPDYEFNEFEDVRETSNKGILTYLINLLEKKGYDIFIRNTSFLGFPSFHIIVPGLSEIEEIDMIKPIDEYTDYNRIKRYLRNLDTISDKEIEEFISLISSTTQNSLAPVLQILNLPVGNSVPWYYSSTGLFITALYYKIGDFENAYKTFNKLLESIHPNSYNKGIITYYKCVRDYMAARIDNVQEKDIIDILNAFYPIEMINGILTEFGNPEQIFNRYGRLRCWNCKKCELKNLCSYDAVERVYKTLKYRYASNKINQKGIKELLNSPDD